MGFEPHQDFEARCIEGYRHHEIPFIASLLDVPPVEVSRTLRKSGTLSEIQSFELSFIVENINVIPRRGIAEYLGISTPQLDQALRRYGIWKDVKEEHLTRQTCIAGTRWLIETRLKLPINDQLPRLITNTHFTEHGLYPVIAFATDFKANCSTAKHFSACAFLICEAYPGCFKPWQFRHAKQNGFFFGKNGKRNFLCALLWLTETKLNITRQALPYVLDNNNYLNTRTLREYGLGSHSWRKHWATKDEMLAALAAAAKVTPAGQRSQNTARVRAQPTGRSSDLGRSRPTLPLYPALSPSAEVSDSAEILENQVKKIMAEKYDLRRGSQSVARDFSKRYSSDFPQKKLAELFTQVRKYTLPAHRPRGVLKPDNN